MMLRVGLRTAQRTGVRNLSTKEFFVRNEGLKRPVSPHLTIYKMPLPAVMSIGHRATGAALTFGTFLYESYVEFSSIFYSLIISLIIFYSNWPFS